MEPTQEQNDNLKRVLSLSFGLPVELIDDNMVKAYRGKLQSLISKMLQPWEIRIKMFGDHSEWKNISKEKIQKQLFDYDSIITYSRHILSKDLKIKAVMVNIEGSDSDCMVITRHAVITNLISDTHKYDVPRE